MDSPLGANRAAFVYNDVLSQHVLREDHPLRPRRLQLTYELLKDYQAFQVPESALVDPRAATKAELLPVHAAEYIEAVERISRGDPSVVPERFNFSAHGDNPHYRGMFEAAVLATGASLVAAELVLENKAQIAFNCSGGLHHAARDHASGFCTFNDPAVAIAYLVQQGLRVAYVDIDAHHGDGVQNAFYDTDRVLTISFHESGRYLFPGTGETTEVGVGAGHGYSVNLPLMPFTGDDVYLWAFDAVVPPLLSAFQPDVLVAQLGVDAHYLDPLAHLQLTTNAYASLLQRMLSLAPRVVALGGGGYDLGAVARVWAMEFGLMSGVQWPDAIPETYREQHGLELLRDPEPPHLEERTVEQPRSFTEMGVAALQRTVFPVHRL